MDHLNYKQIASQIRELGTKGNTYGDIFEDEQQLKLDLGLPVELVA
jgi:hypothetical protein